MTTQPSTEHPPVPQVLQEALKDYPELIAEIQEWLRDVKLTPEMSRARRTDEFESAIGLLETGLGDFYIKAVRELRDAEAKGDSDLIAKAREKEMLMSACRGRRLRQGFAELSDFFRVDQD